MAPPPIIARAAAVLAAAAATAAAVSPALLAARGRHLERLRAPGSPAAAAGVVDPPDSFYNQTLDHFNVLNGGFWQQRFWVNASFFTGAGPLFLYVEGEGSGSPRSVLYGQHMELAANHSALVISLEHR